MLRCCVAAILQRAIRLRRLGWRSSIKPWLARSGRTKIYRQACDPGSGAGRAAARDHCNRGRYQSKPLSDQASAGDVRAAHPEADALSRTISMDAKLHDVYGPAIRRHEKRDSAIAEGRRGNRSQPADREVSHDG